MENYYFQTNDLSVGYDKKALIHHISLGIKKGEIVSLIGPNGAGKSTILKTITRQLSMISGTVFLEKNDLKSYSHKDLSKKMAVVLTERMRTELMTCHDVVATGRYPYTGRLGILSREDEEKVEEALKVVHASDIGSRDFNAISDGQRQRVLLARAICQEPEIIILDEPTSFLDIRHKLELLSILRNMAKEKGITVVMSLHEIDLAQKISDRIICVKGENIAHFGTPEEIFKETIIRELYEIDKGYFDPVFGSIELPKPQGKPKVLVLSNCGKGIEVYRQLQKKNMSFVAAGMATNDIDYALAKLLASEVIPMEPFEDYSKEDYERIVEYMRQCEKVLIPGVKCGKDMPFLQKLVDIGTGFF